MDRHKIEWTMNAFLVKLFEHSLHVNALWHGWSVTIRRAGLFTILSNWISLMNETHGHGLFASKIFSKVLLALIIIMFINFLFVVGFVLLQQKENSVSFGMKQYVNGTPKRINHFRRMAWAYRNDQLFAIECVKTGKFCDACSFVFSFQENDCIQRIIHWTDEKSIEFFFFFWHIFRLHLLSWKKRFVGEPWVDMTTSFFRRFNEKKSLKKSKFALKALR